MKTTVTVNGKEYTVYLYADHIGPRRIVVAGIACRKGGFPFQRKIAEVYRMKDLTGVAREAAKLAGARLPT